MAGCAAAPRVLRVRAAAHGERHGRAERRRAARGRHDARRRAGRTALHAALLPAARVAGAGPGRSIASSRRTWSRQQDRRVRRESVASGRPRAPPATRWPLSVARGAARVPPRGHARRSTGCAASHALVVVLPWHITRDVPASASRGVARRVSRRSNGQGAVVVFFVLSASRARRTRWRAAAVRGPLRPATRVHGAAGVPRSSRPTRGRAALPPRRRRASSVSRARRRQLPSCVDAAGLLARRCCRRRAHGSISDTARGRADVAVVDELLAVSDVTITSVSSSRPRCDAARRDASRRRAAACCVADRGVLASACVGVSVRARCRRVSATVDRPSYGRTISPRYRARAIVATHVGCALTRNGAARARELALPRRSSASPTACAAASSQLLELERTSKPRVGPWSSVGTAADVAVMAPGAALLVACAASLPGFGARCRARPALRFLGRISFSLLPAPPADPAACWRRASCRRAAPAYCWSRCCARWSRSLVPASIALSSLDRGAFDRARQSRLPLLGGAARVVAPRRRTPRRRRVAGACAPNAAAMLRAAFRGGGRRCGS